MKNTETPPRHSQQQMVRRIDALALAALGMDLQKKIGTPEEAAAKQMLEDAKQMWRDQFRAKQPDNAEARHKEAVRLLKKARNLADKHSTLTGDDEVAEIYDLIYDALYVLNPKSPWDFGGEVKAPNSDYQPPVR